MENLKQLILEHDIISFDIFDTLLLRPFMLPKDLFSYIEQVNKADKFCEKRVAAELMARNKICNQHIDDITLNEIYETIDDHFKDFVKQEEQLEFQSILPNKEMIEVFNFAKQAGKKVIITSDMYLDKEFLEKLLYKHSITGYKNFYLSSEIKLSKFTKKLYEYICRDLNTSPDKILHIGDNKKDDVQNAEDSGIHTYFYEKVKEQFIKDTENKRLAKFYNNDKNNITSSILLGLRIANWQNNKNQSYWYNFGYNYGGIIVLAFVLSIIEIVKQRNITDVLLVARDGFPLYEILKKMKTVSARCHYIYGSRKLRALCLNDDYYECCYSEKTAKEYANYINSIDFQGDNVLLVDSCAYHYSVEKLMRVYLKNKNITSVYLLSMPNYQYTPINLFGNWATLPFKFNWNILELILTSKEVQIVNFENNKPVYLSSDSSNYDLEITRVKIFEEVYKGEKQFIHDYFNSFAGFEMEFDYKRIIEYLDNFYINLTPKDKKYLLSVSHPLDPLQKDYQQLFVLTKKNTIFDTLRQKMSKK